jgi:hypothetical protein
MLRDPGDRMGWAFVPPAGAEGDCTMVAEAQHKPGGYMKKWIMINNRYPIQGLSCKVKRVVDLYSGKSTRGMLR